MTIPEIRCRLREMARELKVSPSTCRAAEKLIAEQQSIIAKLKTANRWISVTERLPEHCVTVLSYDGRDYRTIKTDSYDHCFECWLSDMDDILDRNTVTHWMPLPEPPVMEELHGNTEDSENT